MLIWVPGERTVVRSSSIASFFLFSCLILSSPTRSAFIFLRRTSSIASFPLLIFAMFAASAFVRSAWFISFLGKFLNLSFRAAACWAIFSSSSFFFFSNISSAFFQACKTLLFQALKTSWGPAERTGSERVETTGCPSLALSRTDTAIFAKLCKERTRSHRIGQQLLLPLLLLEAPLHVRQPLQFRDAQVVQILDAAVLLLDRRHVIRHVLLQTPIRDGSACCPLEWQQRQVHHGRERTSPRTNSLLPRLYRSSQIR